MNLLNANNELLHQASERFDFDKGIVLSDGKQINAKELYELLSDVMCKNNGLGLSACQIGIMTQAFVFGNPSDSTSVVSVFNPKIVDFSDEIESSVEGCLSFPGIFLEIKRSKFIRARFTTFDGNTDTINLRGISARVFQHEYDHMQGTIFTKLAHSFHLNRALRNKKKLDKLRIKNLQRKNKYLS